MYCKLGKLILMLLPISLTGCKVIDLDFAFDPDAELQSRIISQPADAFADIDMLYLSDEIKQLVDDNIRPNDRNFEKVEILQDLMFGEQFLNIQYSDDRTQTAVEVFHSRAGNCLSVMNLYVAMARYAGLQASFQTVKVRPTWDRRGGLLVLNQHINATGRITARETYIVDFTPEIAVQQLTSSVITDLRARALYFNNLGVERMVAGEFESALVYLRNALWLDQEVSIAWNNIGAVYNRLGEPQLAEYSYRKSFDSDTTNATAVNNLARFYIAQGDEDTALQYRRAITRFNNQNPYYHFELGNVQFQAGDLERAIMSYRKALRIKDVEPDFYFAAAEVYRLLGNDRMAIQMTANANELLAENAEIFQPSDQKVRFIDSASIRRSTSAGITVFANGESRPR
ncbi:MAG: tetratricopeptide repeat protein [Pseudohongiellaceae bacterium]